MVSALCGYKVRIGYSVVNLAFVGPEQRQPQVTLIVDLANVACWIVSASTGQSQVELASPTFSITDLAAMHGLHPQEGACCFGCQLRTSKYAASFPAVYPSP